MVKNGLGEIIIVQPGVVIAQGRRNALPPVGTVVKTDFSVFCIVSAHYVESKIPGRVPTAYWKGVKELEEQQPQVFELMKWMFQVIPVVSIDQKGFMRPVNNVEIHSLLFMANEEEVRNIFSDLSFLDVIFNMESSVIPNRDEMIINLLNEYFSYFHNEEEKRSEYVRVFRHLSVVLHNEYFTLNRIMKRVKI